MRSDQDDYQIGPDGWPIVTTPTLDSDFAIKVSVDGSAQMELSGSGTELCLQATELSSSLESLIQAISDFLDGRQMVSAMWASEPGGVLVDFAHVGHGAAACVVHEMAMPAWFGGPQAQPPWAPVRGALLLATVQPTEIIESALGRTLTDLQGRQTSNQG